MTDPDEQTKIRRFFQLCHLNSPVLSKKTPNSPVLSTFHFSIPPVLLEIKIGLRAKQRILVSGTAKPVGGRPVAGCEPQSARAPSGTPVLLDRTPFHRASAPSHARPRLRRRNPSAGARDLPLYARGKEMIWRAPAPSLDRLARPRGGDDSLDERP